MMTPTIRTTVTLYDEDKQRLERLKARLRQQTSGVIRLALLELERKIAQEDAALNAAVRGKEQE
jgi:predicted transcriptional regulator